MNKKKTLSRFGLPAIIAGYLALCLPTLSNASIWFDEAFSRYILRFNFVEIWNFTSVDVHPPLYYFLLKIWSMMFGTSDFAIRSMSVFFGALTIAALYCLIKRLFNSKTAFVATFFAAFSPLMIRYSQEARMYTLVAFFAILSIRAFYEAFVAKNKKEQKTKWRRLYIVFVALGMWTQYLSALVILALWVLRAVQIWPETKVKKGRLKLFCKKYFGEKWFTTHLFAALLFLPWIPFFLIQAVQVKSGFWIPAVDFTTISSFISNFLFYLNANEINGWLSIAAMIIFGFILISILNRKKLFAKSDQEKINIMLFSAISPIAILFVLSLPPFSSIFMDRYLLPSVILISALFGVIASLIMKKNTNLALFMVALVIICQGFGMYQVDRLRGYSKTSSKTNFTRQAINIAKRSKSVQKGEPIIAENVWLFYEAVQYSTDENKIYFVDSSANYEIGSLKMLEADDTFKIKDLEKFSKDNKTFWLLAKPDGKVQKPLLKSWILEDEIVMTDPVTNKPSYVMQKYSVNNN